MYITVIGLTIDLFLLACLVAVPLPVLFHKVIHSISISLLSANRNGKQVDSVTDQSHKNQPVADKDSTSTLNVKYVMQWVQRVNNKLILYK